MNNNESTALGRSVIITWGGGDGVKPVLLIPNLHPHLPPRFIQLSWLFASHGGLIAHKCVVTATIKVSEKTGKARVRIRQLQRV